MKVLIPIRGPKLSKQRLRKDLSALIVSSLVEKLFWKTIEIIGTSDLEVTVLTADYEFYQLLIKKKIKTHLDDGSSLNYAIKRVIKENETIMLIMPDLPGFNLSSLQKILHAKELHKYIISPTYDKGTAMCILPSELFINSLFGPESFIKILNYCDENKIDISILELVELERDLDTKEDWNYWEKKDAL